MCHNTPTADRNRIATHEEITRKPILIAILCFVAAILSIFIIVGASIASGGMVAALIDYSLILPVAALGSFFCLTILGIIFTLQWKRNLYINNESPKAMKFRGAWKACLLIITVVCLVAVYIEFIAYSRGVDTTPLSQYSGELYIPLLKQISPQEWASTGNDNVDSFIMVRDRYVSPKILCLRQYGLSEGNPFGYAVDYYEMRTVGLAMRYEEELITHESSGDITSVNVTGFDNVAYYVDEVGENMILRSGNIVIDAMYYGSGSLLDSAHKF